MADAMVGETRSLFPCQRRQGVTSECTCLKMAFKTSSGFQKKKKKKKIELLIFITSERERGNTSFSSPFGLIATAMSR